MHLCVSPVGPVDLIADISSVVEGLAVPQAQITAAHPGAGTIQNVEVEGRIPFPLGIVPGQFNLPEGNFPVFQKICLRNVHFRASSSTVPYTTRPIPWVSGRISRSPKPSDRIRRSTASAWPIPTSK